MTVRAYLKSSSLSQKALIFEHRSAVYIEVNEQRSAKNRRFLAKMGDFKQALKPHYQFDATGLRCPLPLLKTKEKIKQMKSGETLLVITSDKASVLDFKVYVEVAEHQLLRMSEEPNRYCFYIQKR